MAAFSLGPISLAGRHVRLEPLGYEHAEALLAAANESRTHYRLTIVPSTRAAMNTYLQAAFTESRTSSRIRSPCWIARARRSAPPVT